ncbi:MAG: YdcF family protein [Parcubacteria group bacterium]|jgi:vancomycin permeability regulator SanA
MKKFIKICIALIAIIFTVIFASAFYTIANYFHASTEPKDCAVVFGAAVWRDAIPSHALYDRTMTGIGLYKNNTVSCLVLSGGPSTYGAHEVDVMLDLAQKNNVATEDIIEDYNGLNTHATIKNLPKNKSFVFVSNDFHLGRIAVLARQHGITDFSLHRANYYHGRYFKEPQFFIHEVIGTIYYFFHINVLI